MGIEVLRPGALTTVQDSGRTGYAARGYPACGACDRAAMILANLLAGNPGETAVLECTWTGPALRFEEETVGALSGADMNAFLNGVCVETGRPFHIPAGGVLELGTAAAGLRTYLAVHGGITVPPVLGSRSTDLRSRIGGLEGRALRAGDRLPAAGCPESPRKARLLTERRERLEDWTLGPRTPQCWSGDKRMPVLRAVPGPQEERFTEKALKTFFREIYRLSPDSDRMAARFEGPKLETAGGADILSDGVVEGSVQVSAGGMPMVMLADHQTVGGYAKIATVIPCDIPALAQLRPGEEARFRAVSREAGMEAMRLERIRLDTIQRIMTGARGR